MFPKQQQAAAGAAVQSKRSQLNYSSCCDKCEMK